MTAESARGSGVAAKGLVEATASPGPVVSLTLDPRAKRLSPAELGKQVTVAFNAALHDLRAKLAPEEEAVPDLASLADQLRDVQDQAVHALRAIGDQINLAMEAAGERARLDVPATAEPLDKLFGQAQDALAMAQGGGTVDPDLRGTADALDGQVQVIAAPGRFGAVTIERGGLRAPVEDLARGIASAANEAMRDLQAKIQDAAPVDRSRLRELTGDIRDQSVQNMDDYAQAIAELLAQVNNRSDAE